MELWFAGGDKENGEMDNYSSSVFLCSMFIFDKGRAELFHASFFSLSFLCFYLSPSSLLSFFLSPFSNSLLILILLFLSFCFYSIFGIIFFVPFHAFSPDPTILLYVIIECYAPRCTDRIDMFLFVNLELSERVKGEWKGMFFLDG